jgi:pantothenate kinase
VRNSLLTLSGDTRLTSQAYISWFQSSPFKCNLCRYTVASLVKTLKSLLLRNKVEVPVYDFVTHARREETISVEPADVIIIEGILVLAMVGLCISPDLKRLKSRVFHAALTLFHALFMRTS